MKIKVLYHSKGGNTRKIAEVIANAAGIVAESISDNGSLNTVDILFIGDGIYYGKIDKKTKSFIKTLTPNKVKTAVVFGTYGGNKKAITMMENLLQEQGINLTGKNFGCRAGWLFLNRNHPDTQDLEAARKFANNIISEIEHGQSNR